MSLRKGVKILLPLVVLGVASAWMYNLKNSKPEPVKLQLQEKVWQVAVIVAEKQSLAPGITLYGRVESPELLQAAAPGAGIVDSVAVRVGATVTKGQTLVSLDQRDFDSLLLQAEAELSDIESQAEELKIRYRLNQDSLKTEQDLLKLAEEEVERMQQLKNQNLGSDSALNQARSELGRQQLSLRNRQLEVESFPAKLKMLEAQQIKFGARFKDAQLLIERSQVIAPFDGIISSVPVSIGDRVAIGETLVTLYPVDSLEIRAHIPATYISSIQDADRRGTSLTAKLEINRQSLEFRLKRLAGEAEATGIDAYFHTGELSPDLRPGALLALNLSLPVRDDVVAIPFQAIYGNSRIYLMQDGRLQGLDVETVGQYYRTDGQTSLLVTSPTLRNGDKIVVTHLPNAVTGLKVKTADHGQ